MFSRYYQSELTYLRELGKEFSAANPSLAGAFAEKGGDPDVERLLEGFAFLTARIRERIDDAVPEVIDAVTQLVVPQLARPIPSCSIVEFSPNYSALRGIHVVKKDSEVGTITVGGTQCRFRTTAPVELTPLELHGAILDRSIEKSPKIVLKFHRRGGTAAWPDHGRLGIFVDGPLSQASTVCLWLHQYLKTITFRSMGRDIPLTDGKVHFKGLSPDYEMLPWPQTAPDGLRLVQEYFTLAQKLLFVDICGLDRVSFESIGEEFELILTFDEPPELPERLDEETFKLHCVPVINLFEITADPVIRDTRINEHLIRAAGMDPLHMEIYSVDSVVGMSSQRQNRQTYDPFYSFSHLDNQRGAFYSLRKAASPIDGALDTYLSVITPSDVEPDFGEEVLSINLTCTNRALPTELRVGDICQSTQRSPTVARFANITEVTRPARPPIGAEMHWRLVSHLALNVHSLTDVNAMKGMLNHYNHHRDSDHQRSRMNELRINALRSITCEPELRTIDRVPVRGFHTHIEVEESGYSSIGDAFLFGCALSWLFVTEVPINSYHRLTVGVHPLGIEFEWPPTTGTQPVF